jgi:two-component system NtrC family sensor kinase
VLFLYLYSLDSRELQELLSATVALIHSSVAFCNGYVIKYTMFNLQPSIRRKITFGYYAGAAVIIGLSLYTVLQLWYVEKKVQFEEVVSEFFDTTLEMRRFEKNFFLYEKISDYQESIRYVVKAQGILENSLRGYKRLEVTRELKKLRDDFNEYALLMSQFVLTEKKNTVQRLARETAIRKKGKEITTLAEDISKTERKRLQMLLTSMERILIVSFLVLSILGIVIGQVLSRMVVRPLKYLEESMKSITEGKLETVSIDSKDREIVSLTAAFNKMLRELELRQKHLVQREKLASLGTLLSGVAHELNNPLSNISSSSQILSEEIEDADIAFQKDLLSQIEEQTDRAKNIVRSLLEFSRDKEFKKEDLILKNLFEETILFIKGEIPTKVGIAIDMPGDIVIFADKQRIQQAFLNLIKNAIQAIPDEGNVSISATKHLHNWKIEEEPEVCDYPQYRGKCTGKCPAAEDTVDIEIKDTGEGIPPEVLPKIFDPFFTTKDVGKGSGLGLSIVQEIIEDHDGCIGVNSEIGKGTTFLIRLPLKE